MGGIYVICSSQACLSNAYFKEDALLFAFFAHFFFFSAEMK